MTTPNSAAEWQMLVNNLHNTDDIESFATAQGVPVGGPGLGVLAEVFSPLAQANGIPGENLEENVFTGAVRMYDALKALGPAIQLP